MEPIPIGNGRVLWDFPEIDNEIPELLSEAGSAQVVGSWLNGPTVLVRLHQPAKVVDRGACYGEGITINPDNVNGFCHGGVAGYMEKLPRNGDLEIAFRLNTTLSHPEDKPRPNGDTLREQIRAFAKAINQGWSYCFARAR